MSALKNNYSGVVGDIALPIFRPLTLTGVPSGASNMNVDGSVTPVEFYIAPPPTQIFRLGVLSIGLTDAGNANWNGYGSISAGLTNGISFFIVTNGVEIPLTPVLKTNVDFLQFCPLVTILTYSSNIRFNNYRVDITQFSNGLFLDGTNGDRFGVRVRDDLTSLLSHKIEVGGHLAPKRVA